MDVSSFVAVRPAPVAVFDRAQRTPTATRFFVRQPDASWQTVSWQQFANQILVAADHLLELGVKPGDACAVYGNNSVAWAAAALAIQAVGGVMVPIYPASTAEQVEYVANHAEIKALFVGSDALAARLGGVAATVARIPLHNNSMINWTSAPRAAATAVVHERLGAIDLDAPGLMLYTSGTSGPPKGVPLSHNNVGVNAGDWLRNHASIIDEGDRDLLWLPMSHIFGFGELCLGNTLGWHSYMVTPQDALAVLPEVKPHIFMSVPAYWEKIARATAADQAATQRSAREAFAHVTGGALRFGLSGGAGLKLEIKEQLREAGLVVIEGYGLTETSPTLTLNHPDNYRFDTVGKPLPSVQLKLADDGEILAKGPNVFKGYYKDPVATAGAFNEDGWFCTGDVGKFTDDGFLRIVDRKKDILVTAGGKNVPPANIEAHFAGDPMIDRIVVYGDGKPYLIAGVWLVPDSEGAAADEAAIAARIAAVNAHLAQFETIKKFWVSTEPLTVEGGLLTSSLKLRRKAVYERFRDKFEAMYI
ncbi:MAG TPA: AMP-dependent synthetase/ligase [Kofleriaceae bacterium]|nr:AMP-dependent synthetase/ligase [Kofleriaceae bacterium]